MSEPAAAAAAATAPAPSGAAAAPLRDFGDWLSPMLVKELRQGTRTRVFAAAFILLQAVLALALLTSAGSGSAEIVGGIFWWILAITLVFIMPLRGFNALASEHKLETMDLILLTRLTAWRIAFGKWAALVSQSALFVAAVLPYVVLRYWLGGVNVVAEIIWVIVLYLVSCVLTAVTVGFSAHRIFLIRAAVAVAVIFAGMSLSIWFFTLYAESGSLPLSGQPRAWLGYLGVLAVAAFIVYYVLDMGATVIAPAAENHATRKRLSGLAAAAVLAACAAAGVDDEFIFALLSVILAVICLDALTETPNLLPSIFVPFVKRGPAGRLAGRFLYPGWHTALGFTLVAAALLFAYAAWFGYFGGGPWKVDWGTENLHIFVCWLAILVAPLAFVKLFFRRSPNTFALYLLVQCVATLFSLLIVLIAEAVDHMPGPSMALWFGCFLPLVCLIGGASESALRPAFLSCGLAIATLSFVILIVRSVPIFLRTSRIEGVVRDRLRGSTAIAGAGAAAGGEPTGEQPADDQ